MKLSVNILTWNTFKTLNETLRLLSHDIEGIDHEIIIVDNGSNDGCEKFASIRNEVNLGISKGKNQGIEISTGDYILLLDGDIVPVPNSIRLLVEHLDNNPECMALGFAPNKFANTRGQEETYCHKLDPIEQHRGHCIYYGIYRREVWFERGVRFDENFGVGYGYEDLDSYMQMESKGIKQFVAGINHRAGKYYHEINSSIRQMGYEKYMSTSMKRGQFFKQKWDRNVVHSVA